MVGPLDDKELKMDIRVHVFGFVCVYLCVHSMYRNTKLQNAYFLARSHDDDGGVRNWWERPSVNGWQQRKHLSEGLELPDERHLAIMAPSPFGHQATSFGMGKGGIWCWGRRAQGWDKLALVYKVGLPKDL